MSDEFNGKNGRFLTPLGKFFYTPENESPFDVISEYNKPMYQVYIVEYAQYCNMPITTILTASFIAVYKKERLEVVKNRWATKSVPYDSTLPEVLSHLKEVI
jgi:hypothetical protein